MTERHQIPGHRNVSYRFPTFQVSNAIAVRILETPRIHLIENRILPPTLVLDLGGGQADRNEKHNHHEADVLHDLNDAARNHSASYMPDPMVKKSSVSRVLINRALRKVAINNTIPKKNRAMIEQFELNDVLPFHGSCIFYNKIFLVITSIRVYRIFSYDYDYDSE